MAKAIPMLKEEDVKWIKYEWIVFGNKGKVQDVAIRDENVTPEIETYLNENNYKRHPSRKKYQNIEIFRYSEG